MGGKFKHAGHGRLKMAVVVITILLLSLIVVLASGVYLAVLLPSIQQAREAERRQQTTENLKRLGEALHSYHQEAETLPRSRGGPVGPAEPTSEPNAEDDVD